MSGELLSGNDLCGVDSTPDDSTRDGSTPNDSTVKWHPDFARTILVGSTNKNKILELTAVARRYGIRILGPEEAAALLGLARWPEVDEHRDTYHGNALLKAEAFFAWSGVPTLGDDSGLEVLALDSRPGVLSARYAPSDQEKIERLLAELSLSKLASSPEIGRKALFRCVLTFVDGGPTPLTAEGVLTGKVLESPAGSGGFGYDPIISIDELGCTLAEVDFEITCRSGFRAKAAECLFKQRSFVG